MEYLLVFGVFFVCYLLWEILLRINGICKTIAYMQRESDARWNALSNRLSNLETETEL